MYKIMLADDEGIVIDSLKFIIKKEFGDTCIVEFAKTGRSVIELAENFRPDIAIMDIQMPGINGIDAMREIRKTNTRTIFIIMSAFDKFDYAKEAITLGVQEYITKPMEKGKIISALQNAMAAIDQEKAKRSNELLVKEKLETVTPIIESGLIYNILFREHFTEDIENYKSILDITMNNAYMIALVCGDEQDGNHMTNAVGSSVRMQNYYQYLRDILKESFHGIVGTVMANKLAVLVPHEDIKTGYRERIRLIEKARELVKALKEHTGISFRIGFGKVKPFLEMNESYNEALNALIITTGSVAHADDLPIGIVYDGVYPADLERALFSEIENGEWSSAKPIAQNFFDWLVEHDAGDYMECRLKLLEMVLWAEHIAFIKGGMTYHYNTRSDYLPSVMGMNTKEEMKEWFITKLGEACQNVTGKRTERAINVIETAKKYIQENYKNDISLDDASQAVNISPYYFSKIFKENTGENFIEYLTAIRMEKAKELLSRNEYSMKEICSMIGYSDPNYFSRTFKKNVGLTPTEYKESLSNDE